MDSNKYKPVNKKTLHLRFMMSHLDNEIGDCSEEVNELESKNTLSPELGGQPLGTPPEELDQ